MTKDDELIVLLKTCTADRICGREPNVDFYGTRPNDKSVTLCVRLSRRDRIIRALKRKALTPQERLKDGNNG